MIHQQLLRAQQRMKHHADKNRCERTFEVGDSVYLKLQPYIQSSVAPRSNQKLAYSFFGPFKILAKVGTVAYKLALPPECKKHPVVHVSQLKKHVPPPIRLVQTCDLSVLTPSLMFRWWRCWTTSWSLMRERWLLASRYNGRVCLIL